MSSMKKFLNSFLSLGYAIVFVYIAAILIGMFVPDSIMVFWTAIVMFVVHVVFAIYDSSKK